MYHLTNSYLYDFCKVLFYMKYNVHDLVNRHVYYKDWHCIQGFLYIYTQRNKGENVPLYLSVMRQWRLCC